MSSAQQPFKADQSRGQSHQPQANKTEEWIQSTKDSSNACKDKPCAGTQTAHNTEWNQHGTQTPNTDWNQHDRDDNPGFFQQTGEQVLHMAQGAVDTVKNKLGMGDDK